MSKEILKEEDLSNEDRKKLNELRQNLNYTEDGLSCFVHHMEEGKRPLTPLNQEALKYYIDRHTQWLSTKHRAGRKFYADRYNLEGAHINGVDLREADFRRANMKNVRFERVNLERTNFDSVILDGAIFTKCNFDKAYMSESLGKNVKFVDCTFKNIRGRGMKYVMSDFSECDMRNSSLKMSTFKFCDFTRTNLSSADLWLANFRGADITDIKLYNANISKTKFDEKVIALTNVLLERSQIVYFSRQDLLQVSSWDKFDVGTIEEFKETVQLVQDDEEIPPFQRMELKAEIKHIAAYLETYRDKEEHYNLNLNGTVMDQK